MAKKSQTPAPPRRVQAPQRRTDPRRRRSFGTTRGLLLGGFAALGLAAAIVAAIVVLTRGDNGEAGPNAPNQAELVGLQTGPAPWHPGLDTLPDRLDPLGLAPDTNGHSGLVLHLHQHLDIFVNGKPVTIPANIGVYDGEFLTQLHTHDPTGIIHVESPSAETFDLGQFFGVWGVRLSADCVGGYCRQVTPWRVYVNGQLYSGNPGALVLREHQEIAVVIGNPPKTIPSKYKFPPGL